MRNICGYLPTLVELLTTTSFGTVVEAIAFPMSDFAVRGMRAFCVCENSSILKDVLRSQEMLQVFHHRNNSSTSLSCLKVTTPQRTS